ncbi:MAG: hypothetical protein CMD85_05930 [Gammaproteobacteria bacterium]|nr:hypothetical protein [Gammaproteobacteria bacterium]
MKLLSRTLILFLAIGLAPIVTKNIVPDYLGFSLEAADEKKKKKARKRVKLPSKKAQKLLQAVQPLIEEEMWAEATQMLSVADADPKFTETDRARFLWFYGYIYFAQEKYDLAINTYKQLLRYEEVDYKLANQARFSLAQLSFIKEDYKSAIDYLLKWIENEEEPSSQAYSLLATTYYQLSNFKKAKQYIEIAIQMAESREIPVTVKNEEGEEVETGEMKMGVARENDYLLKMAVYTELKQDLDVLPIYEILVQNYPKKRYWTGLASLYGQKDRVLDQLGALEAAHEDRLLDKEREYIALGQLLFMHQNPYKAAKALEYGFRNGFVKDKEKTLKALGQYWHAAKELEKAKPAYEKAASLSEEGELFIFLGQVHFGLDEFSEAEKAIRSGIKKGKLKDEANAHMLLGQVLFEYQKWDDAITSFRTCIDVAEKQLDDKKEKQKKKKKKIQDQARKWITYTEGEEERVQALELKRKALGLTSS